MGSSSWRRSCCGTWCRPAARPPSWRPSSGRGRRHQRQALRQRCCSTAAAQHRHPVARGCVAVHRRHVASSLLDLPHIQEKMHPQLACGLQLADFASHSRREHTLTIMVLPAQWLASLFGGGLKPTEQAASLAIKPGCFCARNGTCGSCNFIQVSTNAVSAPGESKSGSLSQVSKQQAAAAQRALRRGWKHGAFCPGCELVCTIPALLV